MNLERSTSTLAAAAVGLGTVMFAVGEENYALAAAAVIVACGSVYLCDRLRWIQIGNRTSNLAALAALAYAVWRVTTIKSDVRILTMADLMSHLQFILQFKPKSTRTYWLLIVVSFLQAAVAAALHTGVLFAFLLIAYLFCALFFLGYFYLYREQVVRAHLAAAAEGSLRKIGGGFAPRASTAPLAASVSSDFTRRIVGIGLGTIALSAFFFVAVPRIGQSGWMPSGIVDTRAVGFSPTIDLTRSSGEVFQDPQVVMQVRFFDYKTGAPRHIDGDVYMRGTSNCKYANGAWRSQFRPHTRAGVTSLNVLVSDEGLVRQKVAIEPLSRNTLFHCAPAFTDQPSEAKRSLALDAGSIQMSRNEMFRARRFEYEIITPGFQRHKQGELIPADVSIVAPNGQLIASELQQTLQFPAGKDGGDPLAGLRALARQIVADVPVDEPFKRAKKLESYLRDSGRFRYSLEPLERPKEIDPLEDFVVNRPEGHCEFFAGALAMMLRSVDIPARIVIGFRGGEYNVVGAFYEFQQLHAHSWVEAYLPRGKVPLERLADTPGLIPLAERNGAWLQLDGTAAASSNSALASNSTWFQVQQTLDYVRFLWNNYVVGMDSMRQQDSIYKPVVSSIAETSEKLADPETWDDLKQRTLNALPSRETKSGLLIWALSSGLPLAAGAVILRLLRRRRARKQNGVAKSTRAQRPTEEFYLQLERLLGRLDLKRSDDQTPREFATAAGGELAELAQTRNAAPLPRRVVDLYYRVRFGNRPLADADRQEVEQALAVLAAALPEAKTNGSKRIAG